MDFAPVEFWGARLIGGENSGLDLNKGFSFEHACAPRVMAGPWRDSRLRKCVLEYALAFKEAH